MLQTCYRAERIRLTSFFAPSLLLYEKSVLSALLASAAKARLRERVRNQHKVVTMLTG